MNQAANQDEFLNQDVRILAAGAGVVLVGKIVGRVVHLLSQIVLARFLGPASFGLYAIGWTVLRLVQAMGPLGLNSGVIRFGTRCWPSDASKVKGLFFQSLGLSVLSGFLIAGVCFVAAPWVAEELFRKPDLTLVLRGFSLAFPLVTGLSVASATTRISRRMKFAVVAEDITAPALSLGLILIFLLAGLGLIGALAASICGFGIAFFLAVYFVYRLFPEIFSAQIKSVFMTKELVNFSFLSVFGGVFTILVMWVDRLLVGYFRPAAEVGIYQAASQSSFLFAIILSAFSTIFAPMIVDLYHKKEMQRLDRLFKVSTKWTLYFSVPLFLVILFAPREVMTVVFGRGYENGSLPMVILCIAQLINAGTGAVGFLLLMTGNQKRLFFISAAAFLVNFTLSWLLIPRFGLPGAAIASLCAISGLFGVCLLQVKQILGLWPYDRRFGKGLLASGIAVLALSLIRLANVTSPVLNVSLMLIMSTGVAGGILLLLGLDSEDKEFIRLVRIRLRASKKPSAPFRDEQ